MAIAAFVNAATAGDLSPQDPESLEIEGQIVEATEGHIVEATEGHIVEATEGQVSQIDVQQAVSMAVANDPGFQQINWAIEKARGERQQATRYPNATMGIISDEIGNAGFGGQYGVFWSRNLVRNNRQNIQHRYFSIEIAALQQKYDIRRWQISRDIGTRILKAARYSQQYEIISQQITALEEILDITNKLFEAGEISNIAVSNIELVIDRLRQELVELQLNREFELRALAIPLGLASSTTAEFSFPQIVFDWQATISQLMNGDSTALNEAWLATHPQINFANAEVEQSRVQIELARAQQCPDVQLQAAINYDTLSENAFGSFQVGMPILKHDRKYGLIAAATAECQRRNEAVRLKEMQLQSAYTLGEGQLATLRSRVTNIREVIIPKAIENLQQIRSAFEVGEAEYLLLRTGLQAVRESQIRLLDAEYELAVASVKLRTLLLDE